MSMTIDYATEIAEQLRTGPQPRTWRKVTTILSGYHVYRLTEGVRQDIAKDFRAAGLHSEPSMMDVDRSSTVRLSLASSVHTPSSTTTGAGSSASSELPAGVTLWEQVDSGWTSVPAVSGKEAVILVDLNISLVKKPEKDLYSFLAPILGQLSEATLHDVLTPDPQAAFKRHGSRPATRQASLFVVATNDNVEVDDEKSILLSLGLIEFAVGQEWLLVARHPAQVYESGRIKDELQGRTKAADRYVASLQECGLTRARSAEAAALAVVTQGVDSFARARTEFASYIDSWRADFAEGSNDKSVLLNLQATLPLVVDALEPLRRPTVVEWLDTEPRDRARELTDHVDHNLDALHNLQATTADALAQADQHQNEVYQGSLATLAAVLLAPALVASIFGANQALEDSRLDLIWLFVAMLVVGVATFYIIRWKTAPHRGRPVQHAERVIAHKSAHPRVRSGPQ